MLMLLLIAVDGQPVVVTMSDMDIPPDQVMVINTANCFRDAVDFLQKVPASPDGYSLLLLEARDILQGLGIRLGEGDFSILLWSDDSLHVITPSGLPILCHLGSRRSDSSDVDSAVLMDYVFSVPEHDLADTVTVELPH